MPVIVFSMSTGLEDARPSMTTSIPVPPLAGCINRVGNDFNFLLDGNYLNDKDYFGDLLADYRGEYRFHLRTESLFHNLDHEKLEDKFSGTGYQTNDQDPGGRYGERVEQDEASFRYKLHNFPLHINLGYWRLLRDGSSQLRFSDTMFGYSGTNTVNAMARRLNQETHEGNFGFDAHLGFVDLVYTFQIRDFSDNIATPTYNYTSRTPLIRLIRHFPEVCNNITKTPTAAILPIR